jgi:uncharacterized low-complexity protein
MDINIVPNRSEIIPMKKTLITSLTLGSALAFGAVAAGADTNPFGAQALTQGYQLAAAEAKAEEGKCGEAKCGGDMKKEEGKCGEGKCGGDKKEEGKCGEGKCGGDKKAEGACGGDKKAEGACGGKE